MSIYYQDDKVVLHHGDCLDVLATIPDASVDAVVCDPPYGIGFMGKEWDSGKSFVERKAAKRNTFDHVGGNHNPTSSADAARTRRVESARFGAWCELWTAECLRVLKPGGHLLAFGGTRTWHRLAVAVEDAGFEIRDNLAWLYAQGFPKSMDVSKAIDKSTGENRARQLEFTTWMRSTGITADAIREATGTHMASHYLTAGSQPAIATADLFDKLRPYLPDVPERIERLVAERTGIEWTDYVKRPITQEATRSHVTGETIRFDQRASTERERRDIPSSNAAREWQGWGTALKPAFEPIVMARKPLTGTVAANVLEHGTGALNIDACRVGSSERLVRPAVVRSDNEVYGNGLGAGVQHEPTGRWPANVILDESQSEVLDQQSGTLTSGGRSRAAGEAVGGRWRDMEGRNDARVAASDYAMPPSSGGASRFFYVAKAPKSERPVVERKVMRLRSDLTPEQVDHVTARLREAGVKVD